MKKIISERGKCYNKKGINKIITEVKNTSDIIFRKCPHEKKDVGAIKQMKIQGF